MIEYVQQYWPLSCSLSALPGAICAPTEHACFAAIERKTDLMMYPTCHMILAGLGTFRVVCCHVVTTPLTRVRKLSIYAIVHVPNSTH